MSGWGAGLRQEAVTAGQLLSNGTGGPTPHRPRLQQPASMFLLLSAARRMSFGWEQQQHAHQMSKLRNRQRGLTFLHVDSENAVHCGEAVCVG